jgi:hypothetical protein
MFANEEIGFLTDTQIRKNQLIVNKIIGLVDLRLLAIVVSGISVA